ncbi:MAG TPA: ATP synthase F1 subunit epsilon [Candidatus Dormibacteraeota bacterium]|nr:ATP synthase F1 subunit epsilon [Candidatus Dormibacteraeota bacterium]
MAVPTRVVALQGTLFDGACEFIVARGADGELGILPQHAPLVTTLKPGPLMLRSQRQERLLFIDGGFLEVLPDRVTILADGGEPAEAIDAAEAEQERRAAEDRLAQADVADDQRTQLAAALERAVMRLQTAEMHRRGQRG